MCPLESQGVPILLGVRSALLPKCSALGSEVTPEGRATLDMIVNACLLFTAPIQEEPLSDNQMRLLSKPADQHDELQKIITVWMTKEWWREQRAAAMKFALGDVQHGPHMLRSKKGGRERR